MAPLCAGCACSQVVLLHRFLTDASVAPPGLEPAFREALQAAAASHHAAVERALDWVIAMCVLLGAKRLCSPFPSRF